MYSEYYSENSLIIRRKHSAVKIIQPSKVRGSKLFISYFKLYLKSGRQFCLGDALSYSSVTAEVMPFCVNVKTTVHLRRLRSVTVIINLENSVYLCQMIIKRYIHYTSFWFMKKYKPRSTENNGMWKAFLFWLTLPPAGRRLKWRRVYSN